MVITITPKTNIKAVLTVIMPYAAPTVVNSMADCVREYCQRYAAGHRDWAMESRARFDGMFEIACLLGQMTDFDAQQVREFIAQVDYICATQTMPDKLAWSQCF